jgi:uncharacterized protein YndB with AHSA1/START domain
VSDDKSLRIERLIPAPPERVFDLWTVADLLTTWWGPSGCEVPTVSLDARPGGCWHVVMRGADGVMRTVSGVYRTIDRPRRLVFTWGWQDDSGSRGYESEVSVTFEAVPGGTRLVLLQRELESALSRERHHAGWSGSFDRLARIAGD